MKYLDEIEVTSNNYEKAGIPKGTKGTIIMPEIRNLSFECELNCLVEIHPIKICDTSSPVLRINAGCNLNPSRCVSDIQYFFPSSVLI